METLKAFGWASILAAPNVSPFRGMIHTLDETLLSDVGVYETIVFCIGVVLLFSRERGRRQRRFDWTRRWGILLSYAAAFLCAAQLFFIVAFVVAGIGRLFASMNSKFQPAMTQGFLSVGSSYLRYGPSPAEASYIVLGAFSSILILLACAPLWDALRSSAPKWLAAILLAPLALFPLMQLTQIGRYVLGSSGVTFDEVGPYALFFCPALLVRDAVYSMSFNGLRSTPTIFGAEVAKWTAVLLIAVWLTVAQAVAWRRKI